MDSKLLRKYKVGAIFTPSAPVNRAALFAGRNQQIDKLLNAVSARGQHAILFGERGVGKTSLANVLKELFPDTKNAPFNVVSTNCDAKSTIETIFHSLLSDVPLVLKETGMGFSPPTHETLGTLADKMTGDTTPEQLRRIFDQANINPVLIIDEVDRIENSEVTMAMADLIKTLSDHSSAVTLVLVGVSDSVENLIKGHLSIERALVQVPMPRMSPDELREIINRGVKELSMSVEEMAATRITKLSHGLPHYTHLLSLHASQAAIERDSNKVISDDVTTAIGVALEHAQQTTVAAFHQATTSPRGNLYMEVLLACALAKTDDMGYFPAANVRGPMSRIMGKPYEIPAFARHLNDFCEDTRGKVLQRIGTPRRYRYRFVNPLLEPFVVMKGISKSLITAEVLDEL